MAKSSKKVRARKEAAPGASAIAEKPAVSVRWERRNVALMGAGLAAVAFGYVALSQGSMTVAPLLLVGGYCVLIPLAFIL